MSCLVTGGSGFIGSQLIQLLKVEGHQVLNYDLASGSDVTDKQTLKRVVTKFAPKAIFHMAGILGTPETFSLDQEHVIAVNVLGTVNMLDVAKKHDAKFLYPGVLRIWHNPYAITKGCGEDYVMMYHKHYGVKTVTLTLANVYGPGQRTEPYKKVVPTLVTAALKGKPLPVSGSGNQTCDLVHVKDVARAFLLAAESEKATGKRVEIGTGIEMTVNALAEKIIELTGSKCKIEHRPWRLGEDPETRVRIDTSKGEELLGFRPQIPFEEGLPETINYYRRVLNER